MKVGEARSFVRQVRAPPPLSKLGLLSGEVDEFINDGIIVP